MLLDLEGGLRHPNMSRNRRIFYGWWLALAAALGLCLGGPPILVFSFPVFLKALVQDFHTTRSAISLAFSLHNLVAAFASPVLGRLVDRVGARRVILVATAIFAALMISNRFLTSTVRGVYIFNMLGAFIGIGCGPIAYSSVISRWFDRRRGSALAVMMFGVGLGASAMPSIIQRLIAAFGWRHAYAIYGVAMVLISLPVLIALLKDTPEEIGLLPDGAQSSALIKKTEVDGLTWREARATRTFWSMVAGYFLLGASVHACVIHLSAMLTDRGITTQTAALASSVAGAGLLLGRVGSGFLLDRYFGPRLAVSFSIGAAIGILLLLFGSGVSTFVGAFLVGLGMGAEGDIIAYLTSRYFGLKAFGEIYGYAFGSFVLAGACGALLMGIGFDRTGSYTIPLQGFLAAICVAIVLFSRLGPYRYGVRESSGLDAVLRASAATS
jgi:MFS family permease